MGKDGLETDGTIVWAWETGVQPCSIEVAREAYLATNNDADSGLKRLKIISYTTVLNHRSDRKYMFSIETSSPSPT